MKDLLISPDVYINLRQDYAKKKNAYLFRNPSCPQGPAQASLLQLHFVFLPASTKLIINET